MRKDRKITVRNVRYITAYKETLKKMKKGGKSAQSLISKFYSQVDGAVSAKVIHKNKGNRLKAKVGKFVSKK